MKRKLLKENPLRLISKIKKKLFLWKLFNNIKSSVQDKNKVSNSENSVYNFPNQCFLSWNLSVTIAKTQKENRKPPVIINSFVMFLAVNFLWRSYPPLKRNRNSFKHLHVIYVKRWTCVVRTRGRRFEWKRTPDPQVTELHY